MTATDAQYKYVTFLGLKMFWVQKCLLTLAQLTMMHF